MAEQSSRTVEERFNWEDGDATLPIGWKMRFFLALLGALFVAHETQPTGNKQTDKCKKSTQQII